MLLYMRKLSEKYYPRGFKITAFLKIIITIIIILKNIIYYLLLAI